MQQQQPFTRTGFIPNWHSISARIDAGDAWYLNEHITAHMCGQRHWLRDYVELIPAVPVAVASDECRLAHGQGNVDVFAYNGVDWNRMYMTNVFHVPCLATNLFSVKQALEKKITLRIDDQLFTFAKDNNVLAIGICQSDGSRKMFMRVQQQTKAASALALASLSIMHRVLLRCWHERFGHADIAYTKYVLRMHGIDYIEETPFQCEACVYGKNQRSTIVSRGEHGRRGQECGEIMHMHMYGPLRGASFDGFNYLMFMQDDYSQYRIVYYLARKADASARIRKFIQTVRKYSGYRVRHLRSDCIDDELIDDDIRQFFQSRQIQYEAVPYSSDHDNRAVVEAARCMMFAKHLDSNFWSEAIRTAVYVLNHIGNSSVPDRTPYELWLNRMPSIDQLRIFGEDVFVPADKPCMWHTKVSACTLVGYAKYEGYRIWNSETRKVDELHDVYFVAHVNNTVPVCDSERQSQCGSMADSSTNELHHKQSVSSTWWKYNKGKRRFPAKLTPT